MKAGSERQLTSSDIRADDVPVPTESDYSECFTILRRSGLAPFVTEVTEQYASTVRATVRDLLPKADPETLERTADQILVRRARDSDVFVAAMKATRQRFVRRSCSSELEQEVDRILLRRSFLWALVDDVLQERVQKAMKRFGLEAQEKMFAQIKQQLLPYSNRSQDPGAFFDPREWKFSDVGGDEDSDTDVFARIGLFRVMMGHQQDVFEEGDLSPEQVAEQVVRDRTLAAP